ncbi:benzoate-CoA ligase family protein [Sneathiella sp. P13V-1]|uniref:benzoate-CoA ligase family protein n=1 Tax=Sneathiella sp. P13V-1 TaxID=2697366 RepID=UPI00187B5DDE|nr:benzoate-CoA ligase family protein [Sneathiella sp. P13V-1]MBE7637467.1 benzoate-CoA ligase family protein [Sneathiella sp. P13V-1]
MSEKNGNAAVYFVDRHGEGAQASKAAFMEAIEGGRELTFGELAVQSAKMADLYNKHGIQREDRAAMIVLDCIEFPVIFWGSLKAGVVAVPVNTLLSSELYSVILRDSRAKALFVSEELLPVVEPILHEAPDLKAIFVIGKSSGSHMNFSKEIARCEPSETLPVSSDECAFWLYSSGSTGQPKGVRHVHGNLQATADTYGAQVLKIKPEDSIFSAAKLFFAYGLGNGMTFPMSVGATAYLYPGRPTPDTIFDIMKRARPSIFCGVPTLYAALVEAMKSGVPEGFENLTRSLSAGEALPAEIGNRWKELTGTDILDGVGSTEMLHIFLSNKPGDVVYGTSGTAVPGYEIRVVDEAGAEVGPGGIGELLVNGPSSADGYWNQRNKSRSTFEGHWTRTGDKYEIQQDGRLVYCGRTDDMFKVSGIWVSPFEIEQALVSHPDILEAAVVPAVDENNLEKPKAFVVLNESASSDDLEARLKDHVKEAVGKWKYPRWIEIVDDLPKTATGKIQRYKLRA